jgi:K+-sensing histidine kinase KdpD
VRGPTGSAVDCRLPDASESDSGWYMELPPNASGFPSLDLSPLGPEKDTFQAGLSAMRESADWLLAQVEVASPEELRAQLTAIRQGTLGLQHHIENLLLVAALRHRGALPLQRQPTAPEDWLREMLPDVRLLVESAGHTLRVVRRGALPTVDIDARRLTQAVANLVMQAAMLSPAAYPVELTLAGRKGMLRVAVVDHGPALQKPVSAQGFLSVVRVADANRPEAQPDSLHLSVAQVVVEAHGGHAGAANRAGGGAVFWLELPALGRRAGVVQ